MEKLSGTSIQLSTAASELRSTSKGMLESIQQLKSKPAQRVKSAIML
jgi:hypothetical protein